MLLSGFGAVANSTATEPPQAIAGHGHIEGVAPARWKNPEEAEERPWRTEAFRHADRTFRFEPGDAVGEQDVGFEFFGIEAIVNVECAPDRRLSREQAEDPAPIMAQDETRPSR